MMQNRKGEISGMLLVKVQAIDFFKLSKISRPNNAQYKLVCIVHQIKTIGETMLGVLSYSSGDLPSIPEHREELKIRGEVVIF